MNFSVEENKAPAEPNRPGYFFTLPNRALDREKLIKPAKKNEKSILAEILNRF